MKPKVWLPLRYLREIEDLCDEYERLYGVCVPDQDFFFMILQLGLDEMSVMLDKKADSKNKEEMKNED